MIFKNIGKSFAIAGLALSTVLSGCGESFLEEAKVQTDIDSSTFYSNMNDAELAVNSVYTPLHWYGLFKRHRYLLDFMSGDMIPTSGAAQLLDYPGFNFNSTSPELIPKSWEASYTGITRASVVLDKVSGIETPETDLKNRILGEAHFMRAFYYFNLVRLYGGVPVNQPFEGELSEEFLRPERESAEEIYAFIEDDLMEAQKLLPASYNGSNIGRATSGAATAYLGKVYLYQQKYQQARDAFKAVIDGGNYSLVNFEQNFNLGNENNAESIFEVQFVGGVGSPWPDYDAPNASKANWVSTAISPFVFANAVPSTEVVNFFDQYPEEEAVRRPFTLAKSGDVWDGFTVGRYTITDNSGNEVQKAGAVSADGTIKKHWNNRTLEREADFGTIAGVRKFAEGPNRVGFNQSPVNFRAMRYADVLLMFAEAENEVSGPTADAYSAVNEVRTRALVTPLAGGLSKDEFFEKIVIERRLEFTFEFHRFFDLVRWSKKTGTLPDVAKATSMPGFTEGKNELLPIPDAQVQTNPNLSQNSGY